MQHTFPPNLHRSHWLSAHNLAPSCTIHSTRIHISSFAPPVWEIIISIYPIITSLLSFPFFPFSFFFFLRIVFRFSKFFFLSFYTLRLSLLYLCFPVLFFSPPLFIISLLPCPIFYPSSHNFFPLSCSHLLFNFHIFLSASLFTKYQPIHVYFLPARLASLNRGQAKGRNLIKQQRKKESGRINFFC